MEIHCATPSKTRLYTSGQSGTLPQFEEASEKNCVWDSVIKAPMQYREDVTFALMADIGLLHF